MVEKLFNAITIIIIIIIIKVDANHDGRIPSSPHQPGDENCCCQEGQGGGEIKGIFAGPKPEKVNRGGDIFAMPTPVLRCGDRHLEVKVEVSIRQGRFVGLIGHPHVFVPIMGLRAEGPAGRGAGQPGGPAVTLMRSVLNSAAPYLASTCATV